MLVLRVYLKPLFLVSHCKIKLCNVYFSIEIDLIRKYKAQATAKRRSRERTLTKAQGEIILVTDTSDVGGGGTLFQ